MSAKTLRNLVVALIVVLLLWGGTVMISSRGEAKGADAEVAGVLDGLTPDAVTSVRVTRGGDTISLTRKGSGWDVNGWAADSAQVAGLFGTVADAHIGDLVATNPANHDRMGVSEDSAWTVVFDVGSKARTLLVGDRGPRYGTAYVRLPGEDAVYLVEGDLRARMDRSLTEWRNKRIAAVDTGEVARIDVSRQGAPYTLMRADSSWTLEGGGPADTSAVHTMLAGLANVRADGFTSAGDSVGGLPEEVVVTALSPQGDTLAALSFGEGSGTRWARARGDSVLYTVEGWRVDRLAPTREKVGAGG
jgi:hypothetical protein